MVEACCDVLGNELGVGEWHQAKTKSGKQWVPTYVEYIDEKRCIGCGLCVKVCVGDCYEMKMVPEKEVTVTINGKQKTLAVKKIAVVVNPDNCMGDCHCHKICPVDGAAIVCKPKMSCCVE